MANVIKAPNVFDSRIKSVFLAGSIDNGAAEDWQKRVTEELIEFDINILNPRRDNWDSTLEQSIENNEFYKQVNWEQNALERSDLIVMYFAKDSLSPISLMEFGQFISTKQMIIYCPQGFWRKGNVDIVALLNDTPVYEDYEDFIKIVKVEVSLL
jgi:hypothetical protein